MYFLEGCCGADYWNGWPSVVSAKSSSEMQEIAFVSTLNNGGSAWVQDTNGYNSGYPILTGIDYEVYKQYAKLNSTIVWDFDNRDLIEIVKSYTSGAIHAEFEDIINSSDSDATKYERSSAADASRQSIKPSPLTSA